MLPCVEPAVQFAEKGWGALMRRNALKFSSVFPFLGTVEVLDSPGFKSNHSDLGNLTCIPVYPCVCLWDYFTLLQNICLNESSLSCYTAKT